MAWLACDITRTEIICNRKLERLVATNGGVLNGITSNIDFDYLLSDTFYIKAKKRPSTWIQ